MFRSHARGHRGTHRPWATSQSDWRREWIETHSQELSGVGSQGEGRVGDRRLLESP